MSFRIFRTIQGRYDFIRDPSSHFKQIASSNQGDTFTSCLYPDHSFCNLLNFISDRNHQNSQNFWLRHKLWNTLGSGLYLPLVVLFRKLQRVSFFQDIARDVCSVRVSRLTACLRLDLDWTWIWKPKIRLLLSGCTLLFSCGSLTGVIFQMNSILQQSATKQNGFLINYMRFATLQSTSRHFYCRHSLTLMTDTGTTRIIAPPTRAVRRGFSADSLCWLSVNYSLWFKLFVDWSRES